MSWYTVNKSEFAIIWATWGSINWLGLEPGMACGVVLAALAFVLANLLTLALRRRCRGEDDDDAPETRGSAVDSDSELVANPAAPLSPLADMTTSEAKFLAKKNEYADSLILLKKSDEYIILCVQFDICDVSNDGHAKLIIIF